MHLEGDDIESRPVWKPMHLQPVYASMPSRTNGVSAHVFATGLCLPSGSGMSDDDQSRVPLIASAPCSAPPCCGTPVTPR